MNAQLRQLKLAIRARDYNECVALLDAGVSPNATDYPSLATPFVEAILCHGIYSEYLPDIVQLLLDRGADVFTGNFVCGFEYMIRTGDMGLVQLVQRLYPEEKAAYLAHQKTQSVPRLLHSMYENSDSPFKSRRRHVEMVLWLHSHGLRSRKFFEGKNIFTNVQIDLVEREKLGGSVVFLIGVIQRGGETVMTMDVLRRVFGMMTYMPYL